MVVHVRENSLYLPPPKASQGALVVKNLPAIAGDVRDAGSIPRSGRSPGGGHGNPLLSSSLGNSMDRGAWEATVHGIAQSDRIEHTGTGN